MPLRHLVLAMLLLAGAWPTRPPGLRPEPRRGVPSGCSGTTAPVLFGLLARPLTLAEMVSQLERGCLVLDEVRFRPGNHAIQSSSPAGFVQVARALGLAHGVYRVMVPPETAPGWPPDTAQALRRGVALREELLRYGASRFRLLEEPGMAHLPLVASRGTARPMLVRVFDH